MDKQIVLSQIDESVEAQKKALEDIEFEIEEAKHQAAVRASYLDGKRRATRDSISALYELKAGLEAID